MAIRTARIANDDEPHGVRLEGDVTDIRMSDDWDEFVAGFQVTDVSKGQHDGNPAVRFTLADSFGEREIGRLILSTLPLREYSLEWTRYYGSESEAKAFIDSIENPPAKPKVVSAQVDFCYGSDGETLDEGIAEMSAMHGISITVIDPHGPGGGWPVVELKGKPENVYKALTDRTYGWDLDETDMKALHPDVLEAVGL